MKVHTIVVVLLLLLFSQSHAADDTIFQLDNGITVRQLPGGEPGIASIVLVCPAAGIQTPESLAAMSLLNEIIWLGGEGRAYSLNAIVRAAERFDGTIASEVSNDGLLIHMSLPRDILPFMLERLKEVWGELEISEEMLARARERVLAKHQVTTLATVESQIGQRLQTHLWSGLDYQYPVHGSEAALQTIDLERLNQRWAKLRAPGNWTLLIRGFSLNDNERSTLNETLGSLTGNAADGPEETPEAAVPQRKRIVNRAESERTFAAVAYRLPAGSTYSAAMIPMIRELLVSSDAYSTLLTQLGGPGNATISISYEPRRQSGMLALTAAWSGNKTARSTAAALNSMVGTLADLGSNSSVDVLAARKAVLMRYWMRFATIDGYTLWRARQVLHGIYEDTLPSEAIALDGAGIATFARDYLNAENSITLETVTQ